MNLLTIHARQRADGDWELSTDGKNWEYVAATSLIGHKLQGIAVMITAEAK